MIASTLAYEDGFVYLSGVVFVYVSGSKRSVRSTCRVFDFIGDCLYFGLRRWICISFCYSGDVDSVPHGPSILKSSIAALLWRRPRLEFAIAAFCDSCVAKRT